MTAALLLHLLAAQIAPIHSKIPEYTYQVVHAYPHDKNAFTEGFFYLDGFLYESTGLRGRSSVRKVELKTGRVLQEARLPSSYFGEGIVSWKGRLLQLTYKTQIGFVYDLATFSKQSSFHYVREGWSMTHNDRHIFMDDGTPEIRLWDPVTLEEKSRITVTANGVPVTYLNELEWVKDSLFANVWHTDRIAMIDATTGKVTGWIDLTGLMPSTDRLPGADGEEQVLNGIAYDAAGSRLFVTGKYWPHVYQIRIKPR